MCKNERDKVNEIANENECCSERERRREDSEEGREFEIER